MTVGHKTCSLAIDDTLKEFSCEHTSCDYMEPELKVLVNAHYDKTAGMAMLSANNDSVQVSGRITVSF